MKVSKAVYTLSLIIIFLFSTGAGFPAFGKESHPLPGQITDSTVSNLIHEIKIAGDRFPDRALTHSKEVIEIANREKNKDLLLLGYYYAAQAFYMLDNLDSCYLYSQKALGLNATNDTLTSRIYNRLTILERNYGHYTEALNAGLKALKFSKHAGDSMLMAESRLNLGNVYRNRGKLNDAIKNYFAALKIFESNNDSTDLVRVYGNLANTYMDIGNSNKTKLYFLKSIKYARHLGYDTRHGDPLNNYGAFLYDEGKYDSALFYFDSALRIYKKTGMQDAMAAGYENVGITLVYLNQQKTGLQYLRNAFTIFDSLNLARDKISVLLDLGLAFEKTGNNDSVLYYYTRAYQSSKSIGYSYGIKTSLYKLYQINKKTGNHQLALNWHEQYMQFKDSVESEHLKKNLQEIEAKYKSVKQEKTILELKEKELIEQSRQRIVQFIFGVIITIVLFLAILFWLKRQKDIQIHRQKMMTLKNEKALVDAEIAQKKLETEKLQNDIEFKTRQLAGHALNMMQKNKLLQSISTDIEAKMKSPDCGDKQAMKQILRSVQQGLNIDKDWDLFKIYFEQINERFFDKLKDINPALTSNDFRLCALTKLNLSIKEMASVLNISPDSLKNARYRLKKKLKLGSDESLNTFLNNL